MFYSITHDIFYKRGAECATLMLACSNLGEIIDKVRYCVNEVKNADCVENRLFFEGMYDESLRILNKYLWGKI